MTDVVIVRWPEERAEVARLAGQQVPRLLLVAAEADPPEPGDVLQDWVRLPSDDRDFRARISGLRLRAADRAAPPTLDRHGRMLYRGRWAQLSPTEERLGAALAESFGSVVSDERLLAQGWPGAHASANALRVHLHRLRRRLDPLGLEVRVVRSEGWVLQPA
jgi:two-component system OmpR family response regulator